LDNINTKGSAGLKRSCKEHGKNLLTGRFKIGQVIDFTREAHANCTIFMKNTWGIMQASQTWSMVDLVG
jgi:hypothetical protein